MGYTHYWRWMSVPKQAILAWCVKQMKEIIEASADILDDVEVTTASVTFNGIGEQGHESFDFPGTTKEDPGEKGQGAFNFTKTAGKPYDKVVVACLLAAHRNFPAAVLRISSDGGYDEWVNGYNGPGEESGYWLYYRVTGFEPVVPHSVRE